MNALRRLTAAFAIVLLSFGIVTSVASSAVAGSKPRPHPSHPNCPNPAGHYPPGQCKKHGGLLDRTVVHPHSRLTFKTDSAFTPGQHVTVWVDSVRVCGAAAGRDGSVTSTITVPGGIPPGHRNLIVRGAPEVVTIPFTLTAATVATSNLPGLPPSSSNGDLVPLTVAGGLLVLSGGATVAFARRRRSRAGSAA